MERPEVVVVMPVYNEQDIVEEVINAWQEELSGHNINYEMHVYNDGSTDGTGDVLRRLAEQDNRIVVHNKENSGHGPSLVQAYKENGNTKWILQIDSDNEIGTELFSEFWRNKDKYDLLVGTRQGRNQTLSRRIISFVCRQTVKIFFGERVNDVNCPFRLIKAEKFKHLFDKFPDDLLSPNIIICGFASMKNYKTFQKPLIFRERTKGKSTLKNFKLIKTSIGSFCQTIMFRWRKL